MKQSITLLLTLTLVLIWLSSTASAITLPNNNGTDVISYSNNTVATNYQLDTSDSLSYVKTSFNLQKGYYPYRFTQTLSDAMGNTLKITYYYTYNKGLIFDSVTETITIFFNDKQMDYAKTVDRQNKTVVNTKSLTYNIYNFIASATSFSNTLRLSPNGVVIDEIPFAYDRSVKYGKKVYLNDVKLAQTLHFTYEGISIEYTDNGIAKVQSEINDGFNAINPVFKMIFLFIQGILKVLNLFAISDNTYYDFQLYVLEPMIYLNFIINTILALIHLIAVMGIVWTFSICTMLIFIYAYTQSEDLLDCIKIFLGYEYVFITYVMIKPAVWIYTKVVLFWTGK